MSCEGCEESRKVDGIVPDCRTARGCRIPPLGYREARILKMRSMLLNLRGLVNPGTVLGAFKATRGDIEVLAMVETELRKDQPKENGGSED